MLKRMPSKNKATMWLCRCDCGKEMVTSGGRLKNGMCKSCGCLKSEIRINLNTTHGKSSHPVYQSWLGMKNRCNNPNEHGYKDYGERGIKICEEWNKFENFYRDMGERPEGMSLDRIDVNGNYCKKNCRWANDTTQSNNRRNNIIIEHDGQSHTLGEWATILGIRYCTIKTRYYDGDSGDRLFREVRHRECS